MRNNMLPGGSSVNAGQELMERKKRHLSLFESWGNQASKAVKDTMKEGKY